MRVGAVALGVILLTPGLALSQVYRWEDQRGILHFTNALERIPESDRSHVQDLPFLPPSPLAAVRALPAKEEPGPSTLGITRIPYAPGSPIVVSARIGGSGPISLILDTGADRTIVAPQALSRLGISTLNAPRAEIRGVTGSSHGGVVRVNSLEVGEAKAGPLRIIAHDGDLKGVDGLLGRDFLEHFTVTIDSKERVVTLTPK